LNKIVSMNIRIETVVTGNYKKIMAGFDLQLFKALAPKQAKMEIVEFTGSKKGDRVHIRFLSPLKADWISEITEDHKNEEEAYFIDEGTTLPFGLRYWRHKHIVKKVSDNESLIIDDITYRGANFFMSLLFYPGLYFSFYPRKKIYRSYFS